MEVKANDLISSIFIFTDIIGVQDDGNMYTTLEPTLSTNPNVYFYCSNGVHPGMIY